MQNTVTNLHSNASIFFVQMKSLLTNTILANTNTNIYIVFVECHHWWGGIYHNTHIKYVSHISYLQCFRFTGTLRHHWWGGIYHNAYIYLIFTIYQYISYTSYFTIYIIYIVFVLQELCVIIGGEAEIMIHLYISYSQYE